MRVSSHGGHNSIINGANSGGRKEHLMDRQCNEDFINKLRSLGHSVENDTDEVGRSANAIVGNQIRNINDRVNDVGFAWHLNASNGEGHGVEVLCYSQAEAPMAAKISAEIAKRTGWKDRGAKIRPDIGVIRSSNCKFFLIEAGFIDNEGDMSKWNVEAITSAVIYAYFGQETSKQGGAAPVETVQTGQLITGGYPYSMAQEILSVLDSCNVTAQLVIADNGVFTVRTDRQDVRNLWKFDNWLLARGDWFYYQ
ncbi:N-acetylmuramoyl-L-alanine amidase [Streptococcus pneumoniae]|nr:N-acetylmuramoyl-L-alanine amidase [Streptococcus pneumoniae]